MESPWLIAAAIVVTFFAAWRAWRCVRLGIGLLTGPSSFSDVQNLSSAGAAIYQAMFWVLAAVVAAAAAVLT